VIVRPVKIINSLGDEIERHSSVQIGADYLVLEIQIGPERRDVRILDDEGGAPRLWTLEMFEVVSPRISGNWGGSIETSDGRTYFDLAPTAWLRPGFCLEGLHRSGVGRHGGSVR
jgi:hypothetical protein